MGKKEFIERVLAQVRFRWDHTKIRDEFNDHFADRMDEYLAEGMTSEEAESRIAEAMGDPEEIGRALNQEHKPWLGWLLLITNPLAVILCILFLFSGGVRDLSQSITLFLDPDRVLEQEMERIITDAGAEPLWEAHVDHAVTLDNETFTFTDLLYFENGPYPNSEHQLYIFFKAENEDLMVGGHPFGIALVTDETGAFRAQGGGRKGIIGRGKSVYMMNIDGFPADAEYVNFRYDRYGRSFAFRVDLKEGVVIE